MQLALVASVASAAIGAVGAIQQGKAQANADRYNAQVADRNAASSRQMAAADLEAKQREQRKHFGSVRASYGASGLAFDGSALDVFEDHEIRVKGFSVFNWRKFKF